LLSVSPGCMILFAKSDTGFTQSRTSSWNYAEPVPTLRAGEQTPLTCQNFVHVGSTTFADVELIAEYRPWILPWWHRRDVFRFKTYRDFDGRTRWEKVALSDPN
jgi:hypothetical protein